MELFTVLVALRVVLPHCHNAVLSVVVDNTVTRGWLRKVGASSWEATHILRDIAHLLLQHNSVLAVRWVKSKDNPRADALSREDMRQLHDTWEGWCAIPIVWL
jgi:ribonuclease HI